MKKKIIGLLLCLFLLPFGMQNAGGDGVTRCLLIGCDRFVSMPGTEPAGANNVNTMEALLAEFLPGDVKISTLVNGPGTIGEFEHLVKDTFREAKAADTALIYLSTHGVMREDEGERKMSLLLSDGTQEEYLDPEMLKEILDRVPGEKVVVLDACHSGADCVNRFEDGAFRVLVSSGADEDSWFWSAETDAYTGTGYFTSAMASALRASDPGQIDPDGSGYVNLAELTERLREIHGASTVYCWPENDRASLFRMPEDRKPGSRLRAVSFGEVMPDGETVVLPIHFRTEESVRVMYQLVPSVEGQWDFKHAVRLPDSEKSGLIRGLVSPGEKERKIRLSIENLGDDGRVLMQIVSLRGDDLTPAAEAGHVISFDPGITIRME